MLDWWFKTCESRPWRTFLLLWLILIAAFLLLGIAGYECVSQDDLMPPKKDVVKFHISDFDPAVFPDFFIEIESSYSSSFNDGGLENATSDKSLRGWVVRFIPQNEAQKHALVLDRHLSTGLFGWPLPLIELNRFQSWGISYPASETVQHIPNAWNNYWINDLTKISGGLSSNNGSQVTGIHFFTGRLSFFVIILEFATLLFVFTSWLVTRLRTRRRYKLGLCHDCGHALGPIPTPKKCPECGQSVTQETIRRTYSIANRLFLAVFAVLFAAFLVLTAILRTDIPSPISDHQDSLEFTQKIADESSTTQFEYVEYSKGNIGVINPFIEYYHNKWYLLSPNNKPIPQLPPRGFFVSSGFKFSPDYDKLSYSSLNYATSDEWSFTIPWREMSVLIVLIQITALLIAIFLRTLIAINRRLRHSVKLT